MSRGGRKRCCRVAAFPMIPAHVTSGTSTSVCYFCVSVVSSKADRKWQKRSGQAAHESWRHLSAAGCDSHFAFSEIRGRNFNFVFLLYFAHSLPLSNRREQEAAADSILFASLRSTTSSLPFPGSAVRRSSNSFACGGHIGPPRDEGF